MVLRNILLTSCRSPFMDSDKVYPPLANLYLQASVMKENPLTNVTVIDDFDPSVFHTRLYDGIGASIMTPQREEAERIRRFVRAVDPKIKIFAGGPHVKHYLGDIEKDDWDHLVPLDGFRAINKIIAGTTDKVIIDNIKNPEYASIIPVPTRLHNKALLSRYKYTLEGKLSTTILTAQGCPEQCTFCEDAMTMPRFTPLEKVKRELDDIVELGYKGIYIFDDIFSISRKTTEPIANEIKKRGLIYRCNGQARLMNEDFMRMLADTGCREIAFGAESGSQKILDNIRKRTTIEQNYRFVEWANKCDIPVKAFLMLGLPGEDLSTIHATERFIKNAGIQDFQLAVYYPYKGTQIRDAIDRGDASMDIRFEGEGLGAYGQKGGSTEAVVRTTALSKEDLLYHRDRLVREYRPDSHKKKWDDKFFDTHLGDKK